MEAHGDDVIETVLEYIQATGLHVDNYMEGIWDKNDERNEGENEQDTPGPGVVPKNLHQYQLKRCYR